MSSTLHLRNNRIWLLCHYISCAWWSMVKILSYFPDHDTEYVNSSCTRNIGYVFVRNFRSLQINSQMFHQYYYSGQHAIVLEKRVLQTYADAPKASFIKVFKIFSFIILLKYCRRCKQGFGHDLCTDDSHL